MRASHAATTKPLRNLVSIDSSCYDPFAINEDYAIYACCSAYATNTLFNSDYQECICLCVESYYGSDSDEYINNYDCDDDSTWYQTSDCSLFNDLGFWADGVRCGLGCYEMIVWFGESDSYV